MNKLIPASIGLILGIAIMALVVSNHNFMIWVCGAVIGFFGGIIFAFFNLDNKKD